MYISGQIPVRKGKTFKYVVFVHLKYQYLTGKTSSAGLAHSLFSSSELLGTSFPSVPTGAAKTVLA